MKKYFSKKVILFGSIALLVAAVAVYVIISLINKDRTVPDIPSVTLDDEMIIVPEPPEEERDKGIVDQILDRLGIKTLEDEKIPLAGSSYYAKETGMIPNDKSKASYNSNLLVQVLNFHGKIVIDDKYYITTPSEKLTAQSIEIIGTEGAELITDNAYNSQLFDTAMIKSFSMKGLSIRNTRKENAFLVIYNENKIRSKIDSFNVSDCKFDGNISLYRHYGDTGLDPDTADFGIGSFVFARNKVTDTNHSFIVMVDIPVDHCEITKNEIHNFSFKFFNISITNGIPYNDKLYEHIAYLKVDGNTVTCDDSWWGDTSSGSYYTFVLFEGNEVEYNNNHVEGLKTRENFAVYDAYLSANTVNYTNNTWKNNICFDRNKTNNTLLKSKEGGRRPLKRNYSDNRFIVEESFAERAGQPKENLYVDFISLSQYADKYTIVDNIFDVYDLRFSESSMPISDFSFCSNTVKAKKASGNLGIVRMEDGYSVDLVDISDNIVDVKSDSGTVNIFKAVDNRKDSKEDIKKINIKNNKVTAPLGYIFYDAFADDIDCTCNVITCTGGGYPGLAYRGRFARSNIASTLIESSNGATFYEGRQSYGAGLKNEILKITRNNIASAHNGMHLDIGYRSDIPTTYKRTYTLETQNGIYKFYYTFTLSYNKAANCAEVTFTNINDKTATYKLGISDTSSNGDGQYIKMISESAANPFRVRFYSTADRAAFYITDYSSGSGDVTIETVSYEGDNQ